MMRWLDFTAVFKLVGNDYAMSDGKNNFEKN